MESYADITPLFDLGQATNFSQLPDDDFLALLQKQFPGANQGTQFLSGFGDGVNPQSLSQFSMPSTISPISDDSSPSPPNANKSDGNKRSPEGMDEPTESALKRKASDDDFEEGPSQKNQHTANNKKGGTTKRKASGSGGDETRLLKRKEQNRAAQRAFRERKEKHVRDLEDKVAALEAKNEATTTENENLRDLLSRLQSENMALRQQSQSFTFTVPKSAASTAPPTATDKSPNFFSDNSTFSTLPRISYTAPDPSNYTNPLDMTSMMSFNPSVLNLLDETPQQTATDNASRIDYGFGNNSSNNSSGNSNSGGGGWLDPSNLTTLSTNPAYFSLASAFSDPSPPPPAPAQPTNTNDQSSFNFDINSLTQWPSSSGDAGTLDDLFGGYFNPTQPMDVDALIRGSPASTFSSSTMSPVVHHTNMRSPPTSASSSPASHASDMSLFSAREGSSSESEAGHEDCPKTREEARQRMLSEGASPFVTQANTSNGKHTYEKCLEGVTEPSPFVSGDMHEAQLLKSVACQRGSGFPSTEQNDQNIEVLTAWRSITRDPQFKDVDITKLCSEFASKARCDGSKVVLEPSGVHSIRESLGKKH
ncbi:DNA-binding transcription factor yap1 [Paramarasmius palmivorus]|uniref:DNA-binding transcription factor yap1 n=1 Tax=Paramarasmius palmivorus TaxID=297713 RepID=A0AAW0E3P2_9AGAR